MTTTVNVKDLACDTCGRVLKHIGEFMGAKLYTDDSIPESLARHFGGGVPANPGQCFGCSHGIVTQMSTPPAEPKPRCPFCVYSIDGKPHDPLKTDIERNIHQQTHIYAAEAERLRIVGIIESIALERCDCDGEETFPGSGEGEMHICEAHQIAAELRSIAERTAP